MDDIRGLFDLFGKFSAVVSRADAIQSAEKKLSNAKRAECGYCNHWMHYPKCPREIRDNTGQNKGPAYNAYACNGFERNDWGIKLIEQRIQELNKTKQEYEYAHKQNS